MAKWYISIEWGKKSRKRGFLLSAFFHVEIMSITLKRQNVAGAILSREKSEVIMKWPDRPNDHCCVQMYCNNRNKNRPIKSEQATPLMEHGTHKRTTMDTIDLLKSESNILRTIFFPRFGIWLITKWFDLQIVCVCNFFLSQLLCADQLIRSSILPLRPTITRTHTSTQSVLRSIKTTVDPWCVHKNTL